MINAINAQWKLSESRLRSCMDCLCALFSYLPGLPKVASAWGLFAMYAWVPDLMQASRNAVPRLQALASALLLQVPHCVGRSLALRRPGAVLFSFDCVYVICRDIYIGMVIIWHGSDLLTSDYEWLWSCLADFICCDTISPGRCSLLPSILERTIAEVSG